MQSVSSLSIILMSISAVVAFLIPTALYFWYRRKRKSDRWPFWAGCLVFLMFALGLESLVHYAVFSTSVGNTIMDNPLYYALYGGLMAGLFEETGRLLAFKTVLRKNRDNDVNALMYGAGHGGFEAAMVLGVSMIVSVAMGVMINKGATGIITGSLQGDELQRVKETFDSLETTPSWLYILGPVERVFAVILHISLSVFVWFAVKNHRASLYFLAVFMHFFVDAAMVILSKMMEFSPVILEVFVGLMCVCTALISKKVWDNNAVRATVESDQ